MHPPTHPAAHRASGPGRSEPASHELAQAFDGQAFDSVQATRNLCPRCISDQVVGPIRSMARSSFHGRKFSMKSPAVASTRCVCPFMVATHSDWSRLIGRLAPPVPHAFLRN